MTTSTLCECGAPLEPKPPPTFLATTRICSGSSPNVVRERRADDVHALGGVVQRQQRTVGIPDRDGGVRLHRIVVLVRGGVGLVDGDRRACASARLDVAVGGVGVEVGVDLLGRVQAGVVGADLGVVVGARRTSTRDEIGCLPGDFGGVGDDATDELAAVVHLVVLQDGQVAVVGVGEGRCVEDGEDGVDAVERLGGGGVHRGDAARGDGGLHRVQVERRVDRYS